MLIGAWFWWRSDESFTIDVKDHAIIATDQSTLNALRVQHRASTEWMAKVADLTPYSIELERVLSHNGQPIVFAGSVFDVSNRQDGNQVEFLNASPVKNLPDLRFFLSCPDKIVDTILAHKSRPSYYLVAAKISGVIKIRFQLDAKAEGYEATDMDDEGHTFRTIETITDLELNTGEAFVARGQCVDIQPIAGGSVSHLDWDDVKRNRSTGK